mmetsp:Transcript_44560/g.139411  ORF Transcript_44560/g.139411 Transcript_44560/m.139411 type:complete len:236 (-) Transcript_44560:297-1004(-)
MAVRAHPARVSRRAARDLLRQPRHARPPARRRPLRCAALARTAVGRDADPVRPGDARKVHLWRSAATRLSGLRPEPRGACRGGERGGGVGGQAIGGLRRRALHDPRRRRRVDPRHRPLPRPARFAGATYHAVCGAGRRHDRAHSLREPRLSARDPRLRRLLRCGLPDRRRAARRARVLALRRQGRPRPPRRRRGPLPVYGRLRVCAAARARPQGVASSVARLLERRRPRIRHRGA